MKPSPHPLRRGRAAPRLPHAGQDITPALVHIDLTPERPLSVCVEETADEGKLHAHMHLAMEIGVLLSGRVKENHGTGWFDLGPGQVWACGSLEVHRWRVVQRAVELRFDLLPSLFAQMPNLSGLDPTAVFRSPIRFRVIGSSRTARRSLWALGEELARKYRSGSLPGQAYVDLLRFLEIVGKEVEDCGPPSQQPWIDLTAAARIQPALAMIEQFPQGPVHVVDAARASGLGESNFCRLFKRITGFSFGQFVLRSRLAHAAHLLRFTDSSVKTVAYRLGFHDASHFHRAFVAVYGVTPTRYRATHPTEPLLR